ncbi:cell wall-binding repeat-containing protein [Peptostreptococcus stomatis]|nr:cell wall-binding repeat-containing protein [Peptostreptococcus stomatis]
MELKNKRRALSSIFVSLALLLSMVVTTVPGQAQTQNTLEIAKYVNVSGASQCGANPESAVYSGKVTMKVPMTEVMKDHEADMQQASGQGLYPWNKNKNGIAYITYDVKFPSNVDFGSIRATETSSFINKVEAMPINNNQVSLKMTLVDENWQGIYNKYLADKTNPNDHTVDIEIPYTVRASSREEAQRFENQFITANGEFTFYSTRLFGIKSTYNSDTASKPFVSGMSSCFSQPVEATDDLEGDLLIGNDTQHDKVYEARKSDVLDITGSLNVKPIKDKMRAIEAQYPNVASDDIKLSDINTSFTATMTLPEGLEFSAPHRLVLEGAKGKFEMINPTINGQLLTVELRLVGANNIDTYKKLADAINEVSDTLKVTVKSVRFSSTSRPNTEYTINGTVAGDFSAKATNTVSGKVVNFKFKWLGKQSRDGADFRALNSDNIRFTLMYKDTNPQIAEGTDYLEGDILIGNDTQHDKVYEANKSDILDITGALNVKPIKQKLRDLENQYVGAVANGIDVSNIDTSFTASITLPDGMEFTSSNPPAILGGVRDKFEITGSMLSGKTLTVKMSLKSAGINTYQQLANAINAVDDTLNVTVKGVKFSSTSRPNTEYTINGTVGGNFTAKATNRVSGKIINFKFKWLGKQSRDGADFRALNSDNIQFTLKYNGTTPSNPPGGGGGGGGGGGETTPDPPGRVDGDDRVETGVKISQKYYDKAKTVIVVRHDLFPDSMTASVLAKLKDAPILLNPTNKLDPRVGAEIKRLGAEEVIIVGGPDSISEKVRGDLKAYDKDKDVERIAGVDRYGTSEMVARRVTGITGKKNTGVIASGQVFPDALSVGTFASRDGYPILLVKKNLVPDQVVRAIKDLDIKKTYIAGGTNTISKSTEAKLPGVLERMAGKDRYETSVAIAKSKFRDSKEAFIASGEEFADALVISPVSGKYNRPTLLASRNKKTNAVVKKYIEESYLTSITAIGGEKYLPNSIMLDLAGK